MGAQPLVSIGLPVYNGENFLAEALDSLINQTYTNLEVIVSDNASTDRTQEICREYAARDPRIRYLRNDENVGAARNYNLLVDEATGPYFKWAAHDDVVDPTLVAKSVAALEADSSYVLAYPLAVIIDEAGATVKTFPPLRDLDAASPAKRFIAHVCRRGVHQHMVFGVVRTEQLRKTRLIGAFSSSDRVLNGELALLGRFYEIPEVLFFKRNHADAHWKVHRQRRDREAWYDPLRAGVKTHPTWRLMQEHLNSIQLAPVNTVEKAQCRISMVRWVRLNWRQLATLS